MTIQNTESILIVEDDPMLKDLMVEIVEGEGFECYSADDGQQACEIAANIAFDLIISDINMPNMDGLSMMEKVRTTQTDTSFLIMTGYRHDYTYEQIVDAGGNDFILKPFSIDEFRKKLKRILSERRTEIDNARLYESQAILNKRLATLVEVSSDLTSVLDFEKLFPLIVGKVSDAMEAERASLYVIDWDARELWTKVAEGVKQIRLPMGQGISGKVAETGEFINIEDAWDLPYFSREFDEKNNFRTKAVICMPITNRVGERIGVLQVINKKEKDRFYVDDEILLKGLCSQVGIALENSLLHQEMRLSFDRSIGTLSAVVDARHPLTAGHSRRVTEFSLVIGTEMNMTDDELETLKFAALLHDIGKIGISDKVLLKNGPFTDEERKLMNLHPVKTGAILENFHFPRKLQDVVEMATQHHEKVNGMGYPLGLKGNELTLGAKIIAVADVFDALTSRRDYPKYAGGEVLNRDPMALKKAIDILQKDAGSHFDKDVVDAFITCLPSVLLEYRSTHFPPDYVDAVIEEMTAPLHRELEADDVDE